MSSNLVSFYIPRVALNHTEESVNLVFYYMKIGDVKRVDFVEIPNNTNAKSAFVHFSYYYNQTIEDSHKSHHNIDNILASITPFLI